MLNGGLGNIHRVDLPHLKHGNVQLPAHDLQLVDGSGAEGIAGGQQRALAVLPLHIPRQFGSVGGFARAVEPHQHNYGRRLGR